MFGRNCRKQSRRDAGRQRCGCREELWAGSCVRLPMVTINISLIATLPVVLFHFTCTVYSSILGTEAVDTPETSVPIYETVRPNIPKEQFLSSLSPPLLQILVATCFALFGPVVPNLCVVSHYPNYRWHNQFQVALICFLFFWAKVLFINIATPWQTISCLKWLFEKSKAVPLLSNVSCGGIVPHILNLSTRWRWTVRLTPRVLYLLGLDSLLGNSSQEYKITTLCIV
jgi:hypothetical protein